MSVPPKRLESSIARFAGKRVVVVGDLIADEYLYGKPARISREAPVLILRFTDREVRLGGGANAVNNVHALGAVAMPVGVVGDDEAGEGLTDAEKRLDVVVLHRALIGEALGVSEEDVRELKGIHYIRGFQNAVDEVRDQPRTAR